LCCLRYGWSFRQLLASRRRRQFMDSWSRSQMTNSDWLFLRSAIEDLMIRDGVIVIPSQVWSRSDLKECLRVISSDSRDFV
jgi:hypothetical protein